MCFPLHTSRARDLDRHREWIMRKMDGKSAWGRVESSQAILPSIMTTEIARNRKTNRVDYRRDSAALRISAPASDFFLLLSRAFYRQITRSRSICAFLIYSV